MAEEFRAQPFLARRAQAGFVDCDLPCDGSCIDASSCSNCDGCGLESLEFAACVDCGDVDDCGCPRWHWPVRQPVRRRRRGDPPAGQPAADPPVSDEPPA